MVNIPSKISDDSFPLLWETVVKEGIKTKKVVRINRAITIFSQIFFTITMILLGWIVLYFLFQNDNKAHLIRDVGASLTQFLPSTLPNIVKIIICLILSLIIPAVCCLLVRFIFSLFSAKYKNDDIGKDGLTGAKAIVEAMEVFKKQRTHYDITWALPEFWAYNLIFSIAFLIPMVIQLYLLADKTNFETILPFILISVLILGLGGLILLLPIAGLKGISNFLCNRTCVFLKRSKEKEYTYAIEVLSEYIHNIEQQIEEKEEAESKQREADRLLKEKEELLNNLKKGQELYDEAMSKDPPDKVLIEEAAKLGSVSACYYLGKNLLSDWLSDMYTSEEKEQIAKDAAMYFDVARQFADLVNGDFKTECQFLWLFSRIKYESNTKSQWKQLLNDLRDIQKAGDLPETYNESLESAIKTVVSTIDKIDSQPSVPPTNNNEPAKELYCKFRNGAICTKNSNSVMIYHCNYVNNPSSCPTARQGGLGLR